MKKILLLLGLLLAASLILTSCGKVGSPQIEEVSAPPAAPVVEEKPADTGNLLTGGVIAVPVEPALNIRVQELKKLSEGINSYQYFYHSTYRTDNNLIIQETSYDVSINGYLVKKSYLEPVWYNNVPYFDAYLNINEHSAWGVCSKAAVTCQPDFWKKAYKMSFYQEKLDTTPLDLVQKLDNKAKVTGEMLYGNRQVTLIDAELTDGKYQRLYVDNFYGLPLRQIIFVLNKEEQEVIMNDYYFDLVAAGAGSVSLAEVRLPEDVVKVE